ncbi:MAG: signal peptidase II [Deltaproteobacteria bacterium]|nr:signal peptidase II [Deltaproteobacteria bacterium]
MSPRYRLLIVITAVIVALDQLTKVYIEKSFALHETFRVIPNFFNITSVRNQGAAFGFLADSSIREPFFITISTVAGLAILWYIHHLPEDQKGFIFPLTLIFAGAMGNLIDRIRLGEVIDFIDVHWYGHHWPAFNVADSAISLGVGLLLFFMWQHEKEKLSR